MSEKPFSQACENNKRVILAQLERLLANSRSVLEIGSGTGQHAVHFAAGLSHLMWQTSDQLHYHEGIHHWLDEYGLANVLAPLTFKVGENNWPDITFDAVFTANTAHIMQKHEVRQLMELVSNNLPKEGAFCQYGPFTENGKFNSQSNADFHQKLVEGGYGGYRDIEELKQWAQPLVLTQVLEMPANNLLLVWLKR
jgi:cyclopropane fatty-acyl-phospholipid synthase-like methyltransferase